MKKRPKLSILSPAHQNEDNIERLVESIFKNVVEPWKRRGFTCEVIIAEDGSTDHTREILQKLQKKYDLKLQLGKEKLGYIKAVNNLFKAADGDLIFFLDSDGEVDPKHFWTLYEEWRRGDWDIVTGFKRKRKPWYRFIISRFNNFFLRLLFNTKVRDANAGFRLYKSTVGKKLIEESGFLKYNFNAEQMIRAEVHNMKVKDVGVPHNARESVVFRPYKLAFVLFFAFIELFKFRVLLNRK